MRLAWRMLPFWSCLCLGILTLPVRAEGEHKKGEEGTKYDATVHVKDPKTGKHVEEDRVFNLDKKEDREQLDHHLQMGEVEHLKKKEEPDILTVRWDLGLWSLVVFVLLCLILKKMAWGPMLEGLQKREHNIHSAIEEAQKAREESQKLREQLQREMDKASEKVREILDEARRDAQRATDEMVAKARGEIQAERDRLRREIQTAQDQAIQELWNQTAQLATQVSAKVVRRQLSEDDHRRLIDEALTELAQANVGWQERLVR